MSAEDSKPNLTQSEACELVRRVFGLTVTQIKPLPSYDDQNFHINVSEGSEYVLKIMNTVDSKNSTLLELQTHAMSFLQQHGLPAQTAVPTLNGQLMSLETIDTVSGNKTYAVRLLTYLTGTTLAKVPSSPQILYQVGKMAAVMDEILQKMEHPNIEVLQRENFIWNLSNVPLLEKYIPVMDGDPIQQVVKDVIQLFKSQVLPKLGSFRKCINHGDFNDHNILVKPNGPAGYEISGIIDFGDMSSGYYVFELSITIMYMMIESRNPVAVGGPVLAGWESVFPLNEAERDSIYLLVLCRFCQSLVLGHHALTLYPENEEYLLTTAKTGIKLLSKLWELGKEQVESNWFEGAQNYLNRQSDVCP